MALTLTKEDGTGKADANSYADVADGNTYHEAHLYATDWTTAGDDVKAKALVMATRVINNTVKFRGYRKSQTQALEWPRLEAVRDGMPDGYTAVGMGQTLGPWWPENVIPPILVQATCELARNLIAGDRTADDGAKGIKKVGLGQGAIEIEFNPGDRATVLSDEVQRMLATLGVTRGSSMIRKVRRG